jgi:hypothetical protein
MACCFLPSIMQPWVATGGADGSIRLFQNIH